MRLFLYLQSKFINNLSVFCTYVFYRLTVKLIKVSMCLKDLFRRSDFSEANPCC